MVKEIKDKKVYRCEECGLEYKDESWAEKCENWCRINKSCNLEIISHALKVNN